jgi:hypothetical protein
MREMNEQARKFAASPAMRGLREQLRKFSDSPAVQKLRERREFEESPTAREVRELLQRFQKIEAEQAPRKRRPGGRPRALTAAQIAAGISLLSHRPKMQVKAAYALLRQELKLDASVSDSALYRGVVSKVGVSK